MGSEISKHGSLKLKISDYAIFEMAEEEDFGWGKSSFWVPCQQCNEWGVALIHVRHPHIICTYADDEDFDPEAGFSKQDGDRWEGEDEDLDIEVRSSGGRPVLLQCNAIHIRYFPNAQIIHYTMTLSSNFLRQSKQRKWRQNLPKNVS